MSGAGWPAAIGVVDSHTEGEPTRVVVSGWPLPEGRTMAERRAFLLARQDHLRQAVVCEPRGHDAIVGALLTPPVEAGSAAGVVFFNNAGALSMCGHGLIGLVRTLRTPRPPRRGNRPHRRTPAGTVGARLEGGGAVTIVNEIQGSGSGYMDVGISFLDSQGIYADQNTISGCYEGIWITGGDSHTISNTSIDACKYGIEVSPLGGAGIPKPSWGHGITGNTVHAQKILSSPAVFQISCTEPRSS